MLPTKIYTITIGASQSHRLLVAGQYFKIMAASGAVTVQSDFGRLDDLTTGQGLENTPFQYLILTDTSGGSNTVEILVGDENFIDAVTGSVTIKGTQGAFTCLQKTITNVSGTLLGVRANRRYVLIQNNDATGILYVNLSGATATALNGVRLLPGESYEESNYVMSGGITAIGSIASNSNIVVAEG